MPAPVLGDYQYQFGDNGTLLNGVPPLTAMTNFFGDWNFTNPGNITSYWSNISSSTIAYTTEESRVQGGRSVRVSTSGTINGGIISTIPGTYYTPGAQTTFMIWAKAAVGIPLIPMLTEYTPEGSWVREVSGPPVVGDGSWQLLTITNAPNTPTNIMRARVRHSQANNPTVYYLTDATLALATEAQDMGTAVNNGQPWGWAGAAYASTPLLQYYKYNTPFVDVQRVSGLDMAEIEVTEADVDGTHGGVVSSAFFKSRTIVIDCTIYANNFLIDQFMDQLNLNFMPSTVDIPFYFKGPGVSQRFILCKSAGIKYDIDELRRIGSCKAQIILKAGDPRKYVEAATALTHNTYTTVNNLGGMETYPNIRLTCGAAVTSITLRNNTQNKQFSITQSGGFPSGSIIDIDLKNKMIYLNGVRKSSLLGTGVIAWWNLSPGNNQIRFVGSGGTPTSTTGSMTWQSGWA